MDYDQLTDKELVELHRSKKFNSLTVLYYRYKEYSYAFIYKTTSKTSFLNKMLDFKDNLIINALVDAIKAFDETKGEFRSIYINILHRKIIQKIIDFTKNPITNYVSLTNQLNDNTDLTLMDVIASDEKGPIEKLDNKHKDELIFNNINKISNKRVKKAAYLLETGHSYVEIANELNCSIRGAYSLIYRYRKQIKKKEINKKLNKEKV